MSLYLSRNTDDNFKAYQAAKQDFEETRKKECQRFILDKTKSLNTAQSTQFWKHFNRMFKPVQDQQVDSLIDKSGKLLTDNKDIEEELFSTFFTGKHITDNEDSFDDKFYEEVCLLYETIKQQGFKSSYNKASGCGILNDPITIDEVIMAIKSNKTTAQSFDNHMFHPSMFSNLGPNAIYALLSLFINCQNIGKWVWNDANVIFFKKDGKISYYDSGAYRPISITSYTVWGNCLRGYWQIA